LANWRETLLGNNWIGSDRDLNQGYNEGWGELSFEPYLTIV